MDKNRIIGAVDHTLLSVTATWQQIKELCDDGIRFGVASVCIPPCFVKQSKEYVDEKIAICTVVGFPNGYSTTATKVFEAREAIEAGADEIDMVINITDLKSGNYDKVEDEIRQLRKATQNKILKVIIETCILTDEEKIKMCQLITNAGADYIKTSTGFSTSGATSGDIVIFAKHIGSNVKIKAAGGIKSFDDAQNFIDLGADRLGTSSIVKLLKDEKVIGY